MAKIGNAEYPQTTFSDAVEVIETIRREKISTVEALAKQLGHSGANSGTFLVKLAALNKYYHLIDQEKSGIALTDRAKRILMGLSDGEKNAARREAVEGVPLFRSLHAKLGADYNKNDFLPRLRELTGASVEEIQKYGPTIQRVYNDASRYMGAEKVEAPPPDEGAPMTPPNRPGPPGMLVVQVPGRPQISVPWDPHFMESVREFLKKEREALEAQQQAGQRANEDQTTPG